MKLFPPPCKRFPRRNRLLLTSRSAAFTFCVAQKSCCRNGTCCHDVHIRQQHHEQTLRNGTMLMQSRCVWPGPGCAVFGPRIRSWPWSAAAGNAKTFRVRYELRSHLDAVRVSCKHDVQHNVHKVRVISVLTCELCRKLLQKLLTMRCTTRSMGDRLEGFPPKNSRGP